MVIGKLRFLLLALTFLAALALAGCGSPVAPPSPSQEMEDLGTQAFQDEEIPCEEALMAADIYSATDDEIMDRTVEDRMKSRAGIGSATATSGRLEITYSWNFTSIFHYSFSVIITGTLANGTVINSFTKTVEVYEDAPVDGKVGTVTIDGNLTGPGGAIYMIDIVKSLSWDPSTNVAALDVYASITKNGQEVYFKDIIIIIDRDETTPRARTLNGTIVRHRLVDPTHFVTVVFTDLVYKLDLNHRDFISGTADIANQDESLKAHLEARPDDFSLYGDITDVVGTIIGSMTVASGVVTIVIF